MKNGAISCPDDTPVGKLVYGSYNAAYVVCDGPDGPYLEAFSWETDVDRKPLPGEYERVMSRASVYRGGRDGPSQG